MSSRIWDFGKKTQHARQVWVIKTEGAYYRKCQLAVKSRRISTLSPKS